MLPCREALPSLAGNLVAESSIDKLASILHRCTIRRDRAYAQELHVRMRGNGLALHPRLGNDLVCMLAAVGCMRDAQQVFDKLACPNEQAWSSLIRGFITRSNPHHALLLFQKMQHNAHVHLDVYTLMALLKACKKLNNVEKGVEIHGEIARIGLLERDLFIGSSLIDMYVKCGALANAQHLFNTIPSQDVVSWTSLIAGYAEHGHYEDALQCFDQMQLEGVSPNATTFTCSLKACGNAADACKGQALHADIERKGLLEDVFVGSSLVDMYAKCGNLGAAQATFEKLPVRDAVSWTTLITAYVEHGHGEEALEHFAEMQAHGFPPNDVTFVCCLKACGTTGAPYTGEELHSQIVRQGLESDVNVGSILVDMYVKCGWLAKAQQVFEKLPVKNIVAWNALVLGYAENGHGDEALKMLEKMQLQRIAPDSTTFVGCLKACKRRDLSKVLEMHTEIERKGLIERDLVVGNTLVDVYGKCGALDLSHKVFESLPVRDVFSWTGLMTGYAEHGYHEEALQCFEQMQADYVCPNAVTLVCILKACGSLCDTKKLQLLHSEAERHGMLERDIAVGNTLVDMYAKCHLLALAQEVFDRLPARDIVSWTSLIAGYAEHGHGNEALKHFEQMQCEGVLSNSVTYICSLKACGHIVAIDKGRRIHAKIESQGLDKRDSTIGNALVNLYRKCGSPSEAQQMFDKLLVQDAVSWNGLMAAYAQHGDSERALECFEKMQHGDLSPDTALLVCSLKACGNIGARDKGGEIHREIERRGLLERDIVGSNLIHMYAKCGVLVKAQKVFDSLQVRDIVSWTALMTGYGQHGDSLIVFGFFDRMLEAGTKPDSVAYHVVLKACKCTGLYNKTSAYMHAMGKDHGIVPTVGHYASFVGLLGSLGNIDEAVSVMKRMQLCHNAVLWRTMLYASKRCGNLQFGEEAFHNAVNLNKQDAVADASTSHVYEGMDTQMHVRQGARRMLIGG